MTQSLAPRAPVRKSSSTAPWPARDPSGPPAPLSRLPRGALADVRGLLFDVDDTLTSHGELTSEAYAALHRARAAGLWLCAVTGRGAGWCDLMARLWPVHAVVGETGGFVYWKTPEGRVREQFLRSAEQLAADRKLRDRVVREVLQRVPGARLSRDSAFRICDVAFDLVEDGPALDAEAAAQIRALLQRRGLTAAQSSVHINTWVGAYGKRELVEEVVEEVFGARERKEPLHLCYVGDSRNDGPLFAYFPRSVGVANVAPLLEELRGRSQAPALITRKAAGAGFVELVDRILHDRG
ncbi:MAG: HAD-IIB family hydrolase [Myxococcota bacterium]